MGIQLDCLRALPGYKVSVLASGLPKARHMVMGTVATLFVGSTAGNILALAMSGSADPPHGNVFDALPARSQRLGPTRG